MILPTVESLILPTLESLRDLGGTARKSDVSKAVATKVRLSKEQLELQFPSGGSRYGNLMNDIRLILLREKFITHPKAGIWQLTEVGWTIEAVDNSSINDIGLNRRKRRTRRQPELSMSDGYPRPAASLIGIEDLIRSYSNWREQLLDHLHQLSPQQLERFFLRIFENEGIDKVEVIDSLGGAEIEGTMTSGGFLTFRVIFNVIRGNLQINARKVEDFRRQAQVSGSDKGLLITTGAFTQEAIREAAKRSSPKIELIDGEQLLDKLKDLELGVSTEMVEQVTIDPDFFANI